MRGARTADNPAPHLLAALDQIRGVVVAQRRVADKSNEIPALRDLAPLDLDGALITADARACQCFCVSGFGQRWGLIRLGWAATSRAGCSGWW